jgi:twitching motility protein PilT
MADTPAPAPVPFNFKLAIGEMVRRNGSDLLLKVGRPPTVRVNGELAGLDFPPLRPEDLKALAEQIMTPRQVKEFAEKKEADFAIGVPGVGRFRTNIYQQRGTLAFAFRAIPYEVKTIRELKLPAVLEEISARPRGLVLVTGITGSGKSTTLAAMVDYINTHKAVHIVTIEDPIEFAFKDRRSVINQREIGFDTTSFARALRASLRQDPDVIFVGEMRDIETTEIAMTAAETGHLVLSTLHTTDAVETVNRIVALYPPHQQTQARLQLCAVLRGVISQRLVTRADNMGMVPAVEILVNTARVKELIADPRRTREIHEAIVSGRDPYGMVSFDQSLTELVKNRFVTYEEALSNSTNADDFALIFRGVSKGGSVSTDFNPGAGGRSGYTPNPATATPSNSGDFQIDRFKNE